ncbi:hypothetical protein [Pseudomonas sp. Z3-6]|uniref:hypothetical protein n=1 Tax=Pseudomonas sp. Z3-6 TaxID=2817411 RepID=UPI003DA9EBC0
MNFVYIVIHTHQMPDRNDDIKFIGVYADHASAEEAVKRASLKTGFSETKDEVFSPMHQMKNRH